jgi:hypothetical protein
MKISGFSMCRNADELYYPVCESITSALPLVDEFVIAVGRGSVTDRTLELIKSINDPKIKIIETDWDTEKYPFGTVHAQQTDLAKTYCSGDWLLYLQADEVLHQEDLPAIKTACATYLKEPRVEGMLFHYIHFWGDYCHYQKSHAWYNKEIRMIRNRADIHSWQSAQSFRAIPNFDGISYRKKEGTQKLRVVSIPVRIFHYGWARPPEIMTKKMNELDRIHSHEKERFVGGMNYGDLNAFPIFSGTHPKVMKHRIENKDWKDKEQTRSKAPSPKHERLVSRLLTWIENAFFGGAQIFSFKNYKEIRI